MKISGRDIDQGGGSPLSNSDHRTWGHVDIKDILEIGKKMIKDNDEKRIEGARRIQAGQNPSTYKPFGDPEKVSKVAAGIILGDLNQAQSSISAPLSTAVPGSSVGGVYQGTTTIPLQSINAPLTANQRLTELKKKIAEYKSLISIVSDASTKGFVTQLLSNIEKEIGEIQAELGRNQPVTPPTIFPVVQPHKPAEVWPNLPTQFPFIQNNSGVPYSFGDFPKDTTTFVGGIAPCSNQPKVEVWDKGMRQESIQYISEDGK